MAALGSAARAYGPLVNEETFSPQWAPHIIGRYNKRVIDPETGESDPQIVRIVCGKCNAAYQVKCTTGAVRAWVNRFATVHYHGDPLDPGHVRGMAQRAEARRESRKLVGD